MTLTIKPSLSEELIRGTGMALRESITLPERTPAETIKGVNIGTGYTKETHSNMKTS